MFGSIGVGGRACAPRTPRPAPPPTMHPSTQLTHTRSTQRTHTAPTKNKGKTPFTRAKPTVCGKCSESYPSISKFNAHRATCKKHQCSKCDLRFVTGQELKEHVATHRIIFWCNECETDPFQSQSAVVNHKRIAHGCAIKCPHCDHTFTRADRRDDHVRNKHDSEKANKCACGATYVKRLQLERHEQQCVVSPIGAANAVKRKYEEIASQVDDMCVTVSSLPVTMALKVFDMVREAAQKKIKEGEEASSTQANSVSERICCDTCGAPYGNRESLKRHIRKKHPRASGSGNENALENE